MADHDELRHLIKIDDRFFEFFSVLRTFIEEKYPAKLANFDQMYGKCSSS
jgi:hypothetical protein